MRRGILDASVCSRISNTESESCNTTVTTTYKNIFCTVTTTTVTTTTSDDGSATSTGDDDSWTPSSTIGDDIDTTISTNTPINPRDQICSTVAYRTISKCSAMGTTMTSSVTVTKTATYTPAPCMFGATCGDISCDLNVRDEGETGNGNSTKKLFKPIDPDPARVPQRVSDPAAYQFATPQNYGNRPKLFMRGEVARAYTNFQVVYLHDGQTTSLVRPWLNGVDQLAVMGLFGCTSVVIVSLRGALAMHFWDPVIRRVGYGIDGEDSWNRGELPKDGFRRIILFQLRVS